MAKTVVKLYGTVAGLLTPFVLATYKMNNLGHKWEEGDLWETSVTCCGNKNALYSDSFIPLEPVLFIVSFSAILCPYLAYLN